MAEPILIPRDYAPQFPELCIACGCGLHVKPLPIFVHPRLQRMSLKGSGKPVAVPVCIDCRLTIEKALRRDDYARGFVWTVWMLAGVGAALGLVLAQADVPEIVGLSMFAAFTCAMVARLKFRPATPLPFVIMQVQAFEQTAYYFLLPSQNFEDQFRALNKEALLTETSEFPEGPALPRPEAPKIQFSLTSLIVATFAAGFCVWIDTEVYKEIGVESFAGNVVIFGLLGIFEAACIILLVSLLDTEPSRSD